MESTTRNKPPRKKNAASQFRSRRKRISHPLLGDNRGDSSTSVTPPRKQKQATTTTAERERAWGEWENVTPATPETLSTALEMAARSPKRTNNEGETKKGDATAAATASYNSSIEAMAAHVEASHTTSKKTRNNKKQQTPTTNSHKVRLPPVLKKRSSGGSVSSTRSSTISKNRKSSAKSGRSRQANSRTTSYFPAPKNKVWRIAIPVLLTFMVCEFCLLVLVFRSKDMTTGETVGSLAPEVPAVGSDNLALISEEVIAGEEDMGEQVVVDKTVVDNELDDDTSHVNDGVSDTSDQHVGSDLTETTEGPVVDEDTESTEESGMDVSEPTELPVADATESAEESLMDATTEPTLEVGIDTEDPPDEPVLDVEGTREEPGSDMDAKEPLPETGMDVKDTPNELELDEEEPPTDADMATEEPLDEPLHAPDTDAEEPLDESELDAEETTKDTAVECKSGEIDRLQSMLEEGFARLRGSTEESDEESSRKLTESLCGNVWVFANEKLSSESLHGDDSKRDVEPVHNQIPNLTLEAMSRIESNPWKSLALESQHCLAGAGLAFLTENVDDARLGVSTKIFDKLSYLAPYDPNARAGLGTSLLLESIFQLDDDIDSNAKETEGAHRSLLMAKYHLKIASFLCSTSPRAMEGDGVNDDDEDDGEMNMAAIPDTLSDVNDEYMATNAAILHNLALAHIALGDKENSIPILLQAAALRRDFSIETTKLYWNAPHEVLQMAEEKALSIAANTAKPEKETKRRIPFLRADLEIKGVAV